MFRARGRAERPRHSLDFSLPTSRAAPRAARRPSRRSARCGRRACARARPRVACGAPAGLAAAARPRTAWGSGAAWGWHHFTGVSPRTGSRFRPENGGVTQLRFRTNQGGKGATKSTRRPQNTEQTAPAPPPSPTLAAVTAPKGPWAHHHRNRHRCRFVDDSAGLLLCVVHQRLLVARGCFTRRLFRAVWQRSNPRRRAVTIIIATVGGKRAAASCHFHHRSPRLRRRRPRSRPTRQARRAAAGTRRRRRRCRRPRRRPRCHS